MGGREGSGSGLPFWSNDCEASTSPSDLSHKVLAPPEGVTYHPGEHININWQSGVRSDVLLIDGPPWAGGFQPKSWQWSAFLQSEDKKKSVTILDNQNFTFGYDVAWKVLDDCTNTSINQTWTIPPSLDVTAETVFNIVVVNMTNPDTQSSTTGSAFTIKAAKTTSGGSTASEPSFAAATATSTATSASEGNPTSTTPTTPIETPMLSAAPAVNSASQGGGQGLAVGAKAGIGAGVGVSVLFFLLALLLFWRRRRRSPAEGAAGAAGVSPNSDEEKGDEAKKASVELEGNDRRAAVEAEAVVPRELAATSNDDEEEDAKSPGSTLVNFDPNAPRYPSGPVEMPANEMVVAEMPDN